MRSVLPRFRAGHTLDFPRHYCPARRSTTSPTLVQTDVSWFTPLAVVFPWLFDQHVTERGDAGRFILMFLRNSDPSVVYPNCCPGFSWPGLPTWPRLSCCNITTLRTSVTIQEIGNDKVCVFQTVANVTNRSGSSKLVVSMQHLGSAIGWALAVLLYQEVTAVYVRVMSSGLLPPSISSCGILHILWVLANCVGIYVLNRASLFFSSLVFLSFMYPSHFLSTSFLWRQLTSSSFPYVSLALALTVMSS